MGRPTKIKTYNPRLTAAQNAEINGVSVETIRTYIRVNGIDRNLDRKNAIIEDCHRYLKKNPGASLKDIEKGTGHSRRTIQNYRDNILSGEKLTTMNTKKIEVRNQIKDDVRKKQIETLTKIPRSLISEFLSEEKSRKRGIVDANRKELWSSVIRDIPKMIELPDTDDSRLLKDFHAFLMDLAPERPMLFIGSGGTNGAFASLLYGMYRGIGKAITPLQFASLSDKAVQSCKILLISKGGRNDDIILAAKRALKLNSQYTACLTFIDDKANRLLELFKKEKKRRFLFNHPEISDGFTSLRGKFYKYSLFLRAFTYSLDEEVGYTYDFEPRKCFRYELNKMSGEPVGLENIEHYVVLYGGYGEPVALDFESVMIESGVSSVQVSDYRNYCHGRFIFASNHTENDKEPRYISDVAVILLISPRERSIAAQIRDKVIPSKTPVIIIETDLDSPAATIDMLIKSSVLIASICEGAHGVNPYSPKNYSSINKRVPINGISFIEEYERRGNLTFTDPVKWRVRLRIEQYLDQERLNTIRIDEEKSFLPRPTMDDLYKEENEAYDASKYLCYAFRGKDDLYKGLSLPLGNMCGGFPFEMQGITFKNSEAAYICGLFSEDNPDCIRIQRRLIDEPSGFSAKKFIRSENEPEFGREDWYSFNVEWMLYCIWHKVQGNAKFRELLMSIPREATIIEDSSLHPHTEQDTASFWGCRNADVAEFNKNLRTYAKGTTTNNKEADDIISQGMNSFYNYGLYVGKNVMGKILMIVKDCLHNNTPPPVDYELIEYLNIYLLGKRVDEKANAIKYHHLPADFYDDSE